MTGDMAELDARLPRSARAMPAPTSRALCAMRPIRSAGSLRPRSSSSPTALWASRATPGAVHLGTVKLSYVPIGKRGSQRGHHAVLGASLSARQDRYEVMLEVTQYPDQAEEIELDLLGNGNLVDMTKLRLAPGERCRGFTPILRRQTHPRGHHQIGGSGGATISLPTITPTRSCPSGKSESACSCVTPGNTYLEAALLLDQYLDVTYVAPAQYPPPRD